MSASWPSAVPTTANLRTLVNNLATSLTADITSSVATISVASTTGFPTSGYFTIGTEVILYTGLTATTFTGCSRGQDGTTAAAHTNADVVNLYYVADHHNRMRDEIIAIAQNLSDRIGLGATQLLAVNGSASIPSYAFANSTGLGFFRQAADTMGWSVSGTESARWAFGSFMFGDSLTAISGYTLQLRSSSSTGSANTNITVANDANTAWGFNASFRAQVGSTSTGDPYSTYIVNGATTFTVGIDNSDSDKFKISGSATLGTSDYLTITTGGQVQVATAGNSTTPGLSMGGTTTAGLYGNATTIGLGVPTGGDVEIRINDAQIFDANGSTIYLLKQVLANPAGILGSPDYSFNGDSDTGMSRLGANRLDFIVGGSDVYTLTATTFDCGARFQAPDGAAGTPSLTFSNDTDSGWYHETGNVMTLGLGGVKAIAFGPLTTADDTAQHNFTAFSGGNTGYTKSGAYATTALTTAKQIYGDALGDGGLLIVYGSDGGGNDFVDLLLASYLATTPTVVSSKTASGSPAVRTYSMSGSGVFKLAMASGTYTVRAVGYGTSKR